MKKAFLFPVLRVERLKVIDCVTLSGFGLFAEAGEKGSFDYFTGCLGENDTRLG